tara:strand:+ start:179 stop:607 length:429 start_codon:yes stop_codon:yes gene_type:complete
MIRIITLLFLFLVYGNFNLIINDMVIFSLINIAYFTVLKKKNVSLLDIFIFILSTFIIEVFIGLPILIGIVVLLFPLLLLNYLINNYNFSFYIKSLIIFLLSFSTLYLFDQTIIFRILNTQYLISILILTFIFLGFSKYGKE